MPRQIDDLSRQRLLSLEGRIKSLQENLRKYEEEHKIEFIQLFPYQKKALDLLDAGKKTVLLQGGNRVGKTLFGCLFVISECLGVRPWAPNEKTLWEGKPIDCRILCEDWEFHAQQVIVPELIKWTPPSEYTTTNNNVGVQAFWEFRNGSKITILTNKQDTKSQESWHGHLVWADEPPPYEKYVANKRGLVDYKGQFLLTMTAISASWVLDEVVRNPHPSYGHVSKISMYDNPTLDKDTVDTFKASLTPDQIIARIEGGWLNEAGLVIKGFVADTHIIDPIEVPPDWPVVVMIDFHPQLPHAVSYFAIDPRGITFLIDESWIHESSEALANRILRKKLVDCWRIEQVFIDPLAKGDKDFIKRMGYSVPDSFTTIANILSKGRISLKVASKDKSSGIMNIETMLKGANGIPSLYFCSNVVNQILKEGTVWEIQRWMYQNGEPEKVNDHFMENLYRYTLTGIGYTTWLGPTEEQLQMHNPMPLEHDQLFLANLPKNPHKGEEWYNQ